MMAVRVEPTATPESSSEAPPVLPAERGQAVDEEGRQDRAHEGQQGQGVDAEDPKASRRWRWWRPGRAGRHTQEVGLGQRVAEDALEGGAGGGQGGAGDEGERDAGKAQVEEEAGGPVGEVALSIGAVSDEADEGAEGLRPGTGRRRRPPRPSPPRPRAPRPGRAITRRYAAASRRWSCQGHGAIVSCLWRSGPHAARSAWTARAPGRRGSWREPGACLVDDSVSPRPQKAPGAWLRQDLQALARCAAPAG